MKNILKEPRMTRTNKKRKERKKQGAEAPPTPVPHEENLEEEVEEIQQAEEEDDYEPETPVQEPGRQEKTMEVTEEFWRGVREQEDQYAREDERRQRRAEARRRSLLDDVPVSIKRKPDETGSSINLDVQKKFPRFFFTYVQNLVMEDEILEALAKKTKRSLNKIAKERKNEWMKGEEV